MNSFDSMLSLATPHLSEAQVDALRAKLNDLLREQALAYTRMQSASLPKETLQELAASILYVLNIPQNATPTSYRSLAFENLHNRLTRNTASLAERANALKNALHAFCLRTPSYGNEALRSTLSSLLHSMKRYDVRFFAHHISGEIDYPLVRILPDELCGIDYVQEYLARLHSEMRLLSRFKMHRVLALLDGVSARWRQLGLNLYAPVATNALGLVLLGEDPQRLHLSAVQRDALLAMLASMGDAQREAALFHAGFQLCKALSLADEDDLTLILALCLDLSPRLGEAVAAGDLSHVFFSFGLPQKT